MKWQVLRKDNISNFNFTIQADIKPSLLLKWYGILFMADSVELPAYGYIFRLTENGFTELLSLTKEGLSEPLFSQEGNTGVCLLQRRKTITIESNHSYRMTIKKQDSIYTGFLEDITPKDKPCSFPSWPVFEFPLATAKGSIAAIVAENNKADSCLNDNNELCENFNINTLDCLTLSPLISMYQNPVLRGYADPDILYHEGLYYMYATSSYLLSGYEAYYSRDLVNWEYGGKVMKEAWGMKKWYWAPGIVEKNEKFYMLASVDEHLGIAVSASPLGPFIPEPKYLFDKSIDGQYFIDDDGSVYIFYVSWREGKTYALYAMKMEPDLVTPILRTETLVLKASEDWEQQKAAVVEAPYVIKHKGKYYLTYSGSHFESACYAVGYAVSDTPLGPYVKYEGNPILSLHYLTHGTGHHCLVNSPSGMDMFIVYHTHYNPGTVQPRNICIDRIRFVPEKGKNDRLEVCGPTVTPQPYPLGS